MMTKEPKQFRRTENIGHDLALSPSYHFKLAKKPSISTNQAEFVKASDLEKTGKIIKNEGKGREEKENAARDVNELRRQNEKLEQ